MQYFVHQISKIIRVYAIIFPVIGKGLGAALEIVLVRVISLAKIIIISHLGINNSNVAQTHAISTVITVS